MTATDSVPVAVDAAPPEPEEESAVRRHPRRSGAWPVALVPPDGDPREVVAVDLSAGGLFVRDLTDLPAGTAVALRVALAAGELAGSGVVRWVRHRAVTVELPAGTGIAFAELGDAARAALAAELGGAP